MLLAIDKSFSSLPVCALLMSLAPLAHAQLAEPAPATAAPPEQVTQPAAATVVEGTAAATGELRSDSPHSWFWRPPLTASVAEGDERWTLTLYGFVQGDFIVDTTRSYDDAIGPSLVARSDTYAGQTARSQLSVRNSRLGLMFTAPSIAGIRSSAVVEADFFGSHPQAPGTVARSEQAFFDNPAFRLRHAYFQAQTEHVDVLVGHTYAVFGFQNYFSPCSIAYLGLPNQLFARAAQLRAARTFSLTPDIQLDAALAATRPGQRDSAVPDFQAGVRLSYMPWKGISTPGNIGTVAQPLSVALSGTVRQFKVNAFAPPPTQRSNSATGWGVSLDTLVPIIAARDADDRGNRLTFTGSFVTGSGIADLITAGGGASFPTLPNPAQMNPPPLYTQNIDDGLVTFDTQGVAHTIDWWAMRLGIQYYIPPTGRLIVSANYTQAHSGNMAQLFPKGGAEIELLARVADRTHYADVNLMWDATPSIRVGLSGQYTHVVYLDKDAPNNLRVMAQGLYAF